MIKKMKKKKLLGPLLTTAAALLLRRMGLRFIPIHCVVGSVIYSSSCVLLGALYIVLLLYLYFLVFVSKK
eukprot:gene9500-6670_t